MLLANIMNIAPEVELDCLESCEKGDFWEPLCATPPSAKPSEKFVRRANNLDSGRPILVGREYQAVIPALVAAQPSSDYRSRSQTELLYWSSSFFKQQSVPEELLEEYSRLAKEKHGFEVDQSLQFLHAYDYNIAEAFAHMSNFCAVPRYKWSKADRIIFKVAYHFFGRDFGSIKNLLKHKTYPELVEYFYIVWKRQRYITRETSALAEDQHLDSPDLKTSPSIETSPTETDGKSRKAKRSALVKVQAYGPKSKMLMKNKKSIDANNLCNFSKTQLRELIKPHKQPQRTRESIEHLKVELNKLCEQSNDILKTLPPES